MARIYKHLSSAKRAGKRLCLKNNWYGYKVYLLDKIYLVTKDNEAEFNHHLEKNEIPVRRGERLSFLVHITADREPSTDKLRNMVE